MNIQWKPLALWFGLFFAFLLQGTLFFWLLPGDWAIRIAPHFVLIGVIYVSLFINRYYALGLGLVFGFFHDVLYYGHMLGVYTSVMGLTGYFCGLLFQRKFITFFYFLSVIGIACFSFDVIVFFIYRLFQINHAPFLWALIHHILPSLLFNLFIAVVSYIPIRQFMESLMPVHSEEEHPQG